MKKKILLTSVILAIQSSICADRELAHLKIWGTYFHKAWKDAITEPSREFIIKQAFEEITLDRNPAAITILFTQLKAFIEKNEKLVPTSKDRFFLDIKYYQDTYGQKNEIDGHNSAII